MSSIDVWGEDPPLPPINQQPWEYVAAEMRAWAEDEDGHYQEVLLMGAEMLEQMGRDQYGER